MPLIDRLVSAAPTGRKFNPAYSTLMVNGLRAPAWTSANYTALANEGFVQNVDVYSCVSVLASSFGGIPWILNKRQKSGPKRIDDHDIVTLLRKPNPQQGGASFLESVYAYRQ